MKYKVIKNKNLKDYEKNFLTEQFSGTLDILDELIEEISSWRKVKELGWNE